MFLTKEGLSRLWRNINNKVNTLKTELQQELEIIKLSFSTGAIDSKWIKTKNDNITTTTVAVSKNLNTVMPYIIFKVNNALESGATLFITDYKLARGYATLDIRSYSLPYNHLSNNSVWIDSSGNVKVYGSLPTGTYYLMGDYISS